MTVAANIDGYVADDVYPSHFHREFAPAWIDAMLRHKGLAPPRGPRAPFRLLDLGCGDGLGLVALAAGHPEGEFLGIDAMAAHVARGQETAARLGLANIHFECARFAQVKTPAAADFDYVTGQGLLSWVTPENREHIFRIAREHLRPGGIACFGYNSLPGWIAGIAFQRIVRAAAEHGRGTATERFSAALDRVRKRRERGAAIPDGFIDWVDTLRTTLPPSYFAHEYLNANWSPLWSADVIEAMGARGFAWLAPGRRERLRDDFCLKAAQRSELAAIKGAGERELVADLLLGSGFRVDIFGRDVGAVTDPLAARLESWWAANVAEAEAAFSCKTPAGTLRFENAAAHAILAGLGGGPRTLAAIHAAGGAGTVGDVLNAADALLVAGHVMPVDPPGETPAAPAFNAENRGRAKRDEAINAIVGVNGPIAIERSRLACPDATVRLGVPD